MLFRVFRVGGAAELDGAPVALIGDYPLERRDYKPFAQCNLCLTATHFLLRMWAFEVSPQPGSELRAVLYLFEDKPGTALTVAVHPEREPAFGLYRAGGEARPLPPPPGLQPHPHSGEDLQGVYWGSLLALPLGWLGSLGRPAAASFRGNFYKLCDGDCMPHKGSCFPADFAGGREYEPESMGTIAIG